MCITTTLYCDIHKIDISTSTKFCAKVRLGRECNKTTDREEITTIGCCDSSTGSSGSRDTPNKGKTASNTSRMTDKINTKTGSNTIYNPPSPSKSSRSSIRSSASSSSSTRTYVSTKKYKKMPIALKIMTRMTGMVA